MLDMYIILLASALLVLSGFEYKNKLNNRFINIIFSMLCIFFICRYTLGTDLPSYQHYFSDSISGEIIKNDIFKRSPLFIGINLLVAKFNGNYDIFVIVLNLLNTSLIGYTINKNSNNRCFSLFLWITSGVSQIYMMSGLRQGLAMSFFFFGYYNFLEKDDYFKYIICILLGLMCHETALIGALVLVVRLLTNRFELMRNKIVLVVLLMLAIIFSIFAPSILLYLSKYLGHFSEYAQSWELSLSGLILRIVLMLGIGIIYFFVNDEHKRKYTHTIYMYYIMTLIYISLNGMGGGESARICDFYAIVELILVPNMLKDLDFSINKYLKIFLFLTIVGYVLVNYTMCYADIIYVFDHSPLDVTFVTYPYIPVFGYKY